MKNFDQEMKELDDIVDVGFETLRVYNYIFGTKIDFADFVQNHSFKWKRLYGVAFGFIKDEGCSLPHDTKMSVISLLIAKHKGLIGLEVSKDEKMMMEYISTYDWIFDCLPNQTEKLRKFQNLKWKL